IWWDWVECQLLRREAEKLIKGAAPPDDSLLHVARGRAYADRDLFAKAAAEFAAAAKVDPNEALLHQERGRMYVKQGEWGMAVRALTRAIKRMKEEASPRLERGLDYARLGLWNEAAADFAKSFALRPPDQVNLWYYHACLRCLAGDQAGYRRICRE